MRLKNTIQNLTLSLTSILFLLAATAAHAETVTGTFRYVDGGDGVTRPIAFAKVEIWRFAPRTFGIWSWDKDATVTTDASGTINTPLPFVASGVIYALRVLASNDAIVVWPQDSLHITPFYREPGEPGTPIHIPAFNPSDVLLFNFTFADPASAMPYNIAEAAKRAADYAKPLLAPGTTLPLVNGGPTSVFATFYNPVDDSLTINVSQGFDDIAVAHEYGHFIQEQIGSLPWKPTVHSLCGVSDRGLAWMEGFAEYFSMAFARTQAPGVLFGSTFSVESGSMCPKSGPTDSMEYFVAASLFDLADAPSDRFATSESHDLVQGMDGVVLSIVDQMDAFGSVPTIWDFRNAWAGRGLNLDDLDRILVFHGMLPPFQKARFISQSVPSSVVAGRSGNATVTMKNIGSTTWTPAGAYRLGSQNPQDNATWGSNRVFLPVPTVAPGQTVSFPVNFVAPATPGQLNFQWEMVQESVEWFGDKTDNVAVSVTAAAQQAQLISQTIASPLAAGQAVSVSVTFKNTGDTTWSTAGGYVLTSANSPANLWGATSQPLPKTVVPGDTVTFTFNVTAPGAGGTYAFQWRMQQNGVGAFGDTSFTLVQVTAPPCSQTACVGDCIASGCRGGKCNAGECLCLRCL